MILIILIVIISVWAGMMFERSKWAQAGRNGTVRTWDGILYKVKRISDSSGGSVEG